VRLSSAAAWATCQEERSVSEGGGLEGRLVMSRKNGPWIVHESAERFRNPHIVVREDLVTQPDGNPGAYATVEMKTGVCVLPIDGDTVHLVRLFRYALGRETIEALSGGVEEGQDLIAAAQREAEEELGISARDWDPYGYIDADTSIIRGMVYLYVARVLTFKESRPEGTEQITPIRVSLNEAVQMACDGRITHAPSVALILRACLAPQLR
jgi:8-oxo-dGTP pyrophosphatase MutT (NUDIX family)